MLVLSRKVQESIVVEGTIIVKVLSIQGKRVRLGIEAPGEITIQRQEVIDRQKESANVPVSVSKLKI